MQTIGSIRRRMPRLSLGEEDSTARTQTIWALSGSLVIVVALLAAFALYANPLGARTYSADMHSTGGLVGGADVRIAGVPVGRVKSVSLADDHVVMKFTVSSDVLVGDQTSMEIRMLTPVGGVYVSVSPSGEHSIGSRHIPADRVQLPFQIPELLQQATPVVQQIDAGTLRQNLVSIDSALAKAPGSVRSTIDSAQQILDVFNRQKDQITRILSMSNEYIGVANSQEDAIRTLIEDLARLGPALVANKTAVNIATSTLVDVMSKAFEFLGGPFQTRIEPLLFPLEHGVDSAQALGRKLDDTIGQFQGMIKKLAGLLGPDGQIYIDQANALVDSPNICVPIPGRSC